MNWCEWNGAGYEFNENLMWKFFHALWGLWGRWGSGGFEIEDLEAIGVFWTQNWRLTLKFPNITKNPNDFIQLSTTSHTQKHTQ